MQKKINRKTSINFNIFINLLHPPPPPPPRELVECVTMEQQVRNQISFVFFINYMSVVAAVHTDILNKLFLQKWWDLEEKFRKSTNKRVFRAYLKKIVFNKWIRMYNGNYTHIVYTKKFNWISDLLFHSYTFEQLAGGGGGGLWSRRLINILKLKDAFLFIFFV